ncbi:MAG TPA: hypothetical protein VMC84_09200 [Methanocella sp.]|uniref:hypothetical protein n=1 Tax=Methanocella sp. TaxID=2052833 RepID=UPI002C989DD2|nr:hypothetical protein [Methanocella sp.]HTY91339.1 hypothetical protein [Methanocella sp.]
MGILDDFINTIKDQKKRYSAEQQQADLEKARRENEAKIKEAREREAGGKGKPSDYGMVGDVIDRMKEQRKQFEEASKGGKPVPKYAEAPTKTIQEQKPDVVKAYGRIFTHLSGQQPHVWFDEAAKAVYIDNVDEYSKEGGKVEQRDITAAMDPYMYDIYTSKGGPVGQARYYKAGSMVVSLVPDPFRNYR